MGVILLLALVIGLALYPKQSDSPTTAHDISSNTVKTDNATYGVALSDMLYNADYNKRLEVLTKIKKAGFTEVRVSLNWHDVESRQGHYNWVHLDNMMKAAKKTGLKTVMLTNTTPVWARQDTCKASMACPPENPSDYANFVAAAANRYKNDNVSAWEIWNEENGNNFWKPRPNPEQYALLLRTSYTAIKKADPKAIVLVGGLSGDSVDLIGPNLIDPRTFMTKLYAAGAHGYFDGVAYHPYFGMGLLTKKGEYNGWAKMNMGNNSIRSIMKTNGDEAKDIWITEFGIPTGGSGPVVTDPAQVPNKADHMSLEAQAQVTRAVVDSVRHSPWIHNLDWYSYKDDSLAKTYNGAAFGIWQLDGTPKPMLEVLQKGMQEKRE